MEIQEITSRSNPLLTQVRKLSSSATYRKETGLFLGDGRKLVESAFSSSFPLETLLFTSDGESLVASAPPTVRKVRVSTSIMESISPMKTPQGILFLGKIPDYPLPSPLPQRNYLLLDGVQDPGNVGTIWRTVQGLGNTSLVLLQDCASPWNPKTIRSSMGACFHVPIYQSTREEMVSVCQREKIPLYGTCLDPESKPFSASVLPSTPVSVVLGSEGRGVSSSLLASCEEKIYLPMKQGCESLNVAVMASILLWEMAQNTSHE